MYSIYIFRLSISLGKRSDGALVLSSSRGPVDRTLKRKKGSVILYVSVRFEFFSSPFNKIQIILDLQISPQKFEINKIRSKAERKTCNIKIHMTNSKIILKKKKPIQVIIFFDATIRNAQLTEKHNFHERKKRGQIPERNDRKTRWNPV